MCTINYPYQVCYTLCTCCCTQPENRFEEGHHCPVVAGFLPERVDEDDITSEEQQALDDLPF